METTLNALLPLVAILSCGLFLRRTGFLTQPFWDQAENLTYYVLMPVMLVRNIAASTLGDVPLGDLIVVVYVATFGSAALLFAAYLAFKSRWNAPVFTSVYQGGVRFNTYIALSLVGAIYGETGIAVGALLAGFLIVAINLLVVSGMSAVLNKEGSPWKNVLKELARNPLIIACLIGGAVNFSGLTFPVWFDASLGLIGRMALPVALLCVGASLSLRRLKGDLTPAIIASLFQLVLKPAIALGTALWLGLAGMALAVPMIFMAVPTAVSSYILARKLGGDQEAMATIITFQTIVAFASLSALLMGLHYFA